MGWDSFAINRPAVATQEDVSTTAIILAAANTYRRALVLANAGPDILYLGPTSAVTVATGVPVAAGASFVDEKSTSAWYGICDTGDTADVRMIEVS